MDGGQSRGKTQPLQAATIKTKIVTQPSLAPIYEPKESALEADDAARPGNEPRAMKLRQAHIPQDQLPDHSGQGAGQFKNRFWEV